MWQQFTPRWCHCDNTLRLEGRWDAQQGNQMEGNRFLGLGLILESGLSPTSLQLNDHWGWRPLFGINSKSFPSFSVSSFNINWKKKLIWAFLYAGFLGSLAGPPPSDCFWASSLPQSWVFGLLRWSILKATSSITHFHPLSLYRWLPRPHPSPPFHLSSWHAHPATPGMHIQPLTGHPHSGASWVLEMVYPEHPAFSGWS